jgi:hypothetical protein
MNLFYRSEPVNTVHNLSFKRHFGGHVFDAPSDFFGITYAPSDKNGGVHHDKQSCC